MPKRPSQEDGPENEQDRGKARCLDFGGILGPRVQEIEAAAEIIGGFNESSLRCLAARGDFGVKRPLRKPDKFGAEHDVFLSDDGLRVFKHARNYGFGPAIESGQLVMKRADPDEYVLRHCLMEQVFPTQVLVEGLTREGHFVISQRVIQGNHPTESAIRKFFLAKRFINVPARFGQGGLAWFHQETGILVMDTAPDNFVSAKQGIVPIDLQIAELSGPLLKLAADVVALSGRAPRSG